MEMTKASFLTESLNRSNIKDTQKEIWHSDTKIWKMSSRNNLD